MDSGLERPPSGQERELADNSREGALQYLQRGTWLTIGGTVAGNVAPVLVILLARAFSPEVFGLYVSLQLMVLTVSKAATFGLDRGLAWYVAGHQRNPEASRLAVEGATTLALLLSAGVLVVLGALTQLPVLPAWLTALVGGDGWFALACFSALPSWCLMHLYAGALEGVRRPGYRIYLNQSLVTALAPTIALGLNALGLGRWALPSGLLVANTAGAILIARAAKRYLPGLRYRLTLRLGRPLVAYSWPIGLSEVVASLRIRMDLWLVLALAGPLPAGVFAVMSTLPNGVRKIRQTYEPMVISLVSSMDRNDSARLREIFSYAVHMVSSLQLALTTVVALFPEELLSLAGRAYVVQPGAISVLLLGHLFIGSFGMTGTVVLGLGHSRALLLVNVGALALGAGLNLALIPSYGLFGAAMASALTAVVMCAALLALQVYLTRTWLFAQHLWSNLLVALAIGTGVMLQRYGADWSFLERAATALGCGAVIAANLRWKARQFKHA